MVEIENVKGKKGKYIGEISALCFLPSLSSSLLLPYLLAGSGSEVLLYNLENGKLVNSFHVFRGIRVHGITYSSSSIIKKNKSDDIDIDIDIEEEWSIAVYGERRVNLFKLTIINTIIQQQSTLIININTRLVLIHSLPKFTHWVLDVSFLNHHHHHDNHSLVIGCMDNSLHFCNSSSSSSITSQPIITKLISPDKCLLYSMRMWGNTVETLQIASGTIFNQIIVWKVVPYIPSLHSDVDLAVSLEESPQGEGQQYQAVRICRLAGHEGSIFRIDWSCDGNRLISVSDDRSARLWDIHWDKQGLDSLGEVLGSHSVGPVLFGHNARVWDCCLLDNLIVTAGEDCTCRVWAPDGNQLQMIKEHIGRGIWRCLYDPNSSLLVTAGFDSSIKVHKLHDSTEVKELAVRAIDFAIRIPCASDNAGLMNSKSEYVRCLHFTCENTLYVATNTGYLYLATLSNTEDVRWIELVRVSEAVAIVCMDVLSIVSSDNPIIGEDWVACGDGKGNMTIVSIISDDSKMPKVGVTFTWSAGLERQLLGTYWCKSLGSRFIFTSDPRGTLTLWRLGDPLRPASHDTLRSSGVSFIARFVSCFGIRIMCLDASFEQEMLVCGDLRGNLMLFPMFKHLLLGISSEPEKEVCTLNHFKSAHGISSVCSISVASYSSSQLEILSTGGDGCICSLEYDGSTQILDFLGMKQMKELSLVQSVSSNFLTKGSYVIGFSSTNFLIWNLASEAKVVQVPCGGWRRPYSYYLGNVPETQNCFAFVKDEIIYIRKFWIHDSERKIYPQNLHLQFHGREMHSICFISDDSPYDSNKVQLSKPCWIATGCEDGTVRMTGYDPSIGEWYASTLLGEHVGGSSVRSLCYISTLHEYSQDLSTLPVETTMHQATDKLSLLISVGAKRVLTCWKQKNRAIEQKEETVAPELSPSMSFQWLSSDMPVKQCSTRGGRKEEVATEKKVENDALSYPEEEKLESDRCLGDEYENDWRYLAVTAFLVKVSYPRLTVCFVIVACSDATLALRALLLPYRLWFDIASLVPQSTPILALQHAVIPVAATSDVNDHSKSVYVVIGGSTDGNITFWDLTQSVEKFIHSLPALQLEKTIDCQKRPRTGRGSQGGRWWKSSVQNIPSPNPNDSEVNDVNWLKPVLHDIPTESNDSSNGETNSVKCSVWPLLVLSGVHQSGVNCLHISVIPKGKTGTNFGGNLYCVLSGGDDQALHSLVFDLEMLPLSQCTKYKIQKIVSDSSINGVTETDVRFGQPSNYSIRVCHRGKVASAHSSAVKGIWTDGFYVFSTGLDQRIRCWVIEENGKLKERSCLIVSVPEPEALDARPYGKDCYQIVVAGRGMQIVDFSTLSDSMNL